MTLSCLLPVPPVVDLTQPRELEHCPECYEPIDPTDDPHWDDEGRERHERCCPECGWVAIPEEETQ